MLAQQNVWDLGRPLAEFKPFLKTCPMMQPCFLYVPQVPACIQFRERALRSMHLGTLALVCAACALNARMLDAGIDAEIWVHTAASTDLDNCTWACNLGKCIQVQASNCMHLGACLAHVLRRMHACHQHAGGCMHLKTCMHLEASRALLVKILKQGSCAPHDVMRTSHA